MARKLNWNRLPAWYIWVISTICFLTYKLNEWSFWGYLACLAIASIIIAGWELATGRDKINDETSTK